MGKKEDLETLDTLVLGKMIKMVKEEDYENLSALSVPSNYLKANQMVSEKPKSTVEEDIKARTEKAKQRRAKKEEL